MKQRNSHISSITAAFRTKWKTSVFSVQYSVFLANFFPVWAYFFLRAIDCKPASTKFCQHASVLWHELKNIKKTHLHQTHCFLSIVGSFRSGKIQLVSKVVRNQCNFLKPALNRMFFYKFFNRHFSTLSL